MKSVHLFGVIKEISNIATSVRAP